MAPQFFRQKEPGDATSFFILLSPRARAAGPNAKCEVNHPKPDAKQR